jgi:hypothetical protein
MTTQNDALPVSAEPGKAARKAVYRRTCLECGAGFKSWHPDAAFCSREHGTAFHNRSAKRGKVATPFLLAWRGKRGSGDVAKYAFQELCRMADLWNAEDREAGRPNMIPLVEGKRRDGWSAVDMPSLSKSVRDAALAADRS